MAVDGTTWHNTRETQANMTRRGYGTGTKQEIRPGVWRIGAYDKELGRPRKATVKGNERAAEAALRALIKKIEDRQLISDDVSLSELLERYCAHIEARGRKPRTVAGYREKIRRYIDERDDDVNIAECLTSKPLGEIKLSALCAKGGVRRIDQLYTHLLVHGASANGKPLRAGSVYQVHAVLRAALRQAERWEMIPRSPMGQVSPPSIHRAPFVIPSIDQVAQLYLAALQDDSVLACAIGLAALTGARRGELCALRRSDVSADEGGIVHIRRSIAVVAGERYEQDTKSHAERTTALDETGVLVLVERAAYQEELAERAESPLIDDPYLLSYNANGGRAVYPDTITRRFGALRDRLGLDPGIHLHSLRHFSVSNLLSQGVDVATVMRRHGHASIATTNIYTHAMPGGDERAAGVVGAQWQAALEKAAS